jgi:hypothetical protein
LRDHQTSSSVTEALDDDPERRPPAVATAPARLGDLLLT